MKFATVINCMDGRVQIPVIEWMRKNFGVEYVDMITEPGPDKILAENSGETVINRLKLKTEISVHVHGSKVIAIAGHFDCAGNPVTEDIHKKQILEAVKNVKSWKFNAEVIGLWIDKNWKVHRIG